MNTPALKINSFGLLVLDDAGVLAEALRSAGLRPAVQISAVDAAHCRALMTRSAADVLVVDGELGDREGALGEITVLRVHVGRLPAYRGRLAGRWALYHDEPMEVCVEILKPSGLGPILGKCPLPVHRGDTLADIERRGLVLGGALLADVLRRAMSEGIMMTPQQPWEGRVFPDELPEDIARELQRRLEAQEYSHYA